jgi:FKBP-type peptidyl-prolyl cis-trans isomerase (trigger factor)
MLKYYLMKIESQNLPNAEIKLTVTLENEKVREVHDKVVAKVVASSEIKGFRKGKAPVEEVLKRADFSKIEGETVSELLKTYYPGIVKEKGIFPYSNPKIELKQFAVDKEFIFEATVALKPEYKVADYKKIVKELKLEIEKENKELEKNKGNKEENKEEGKEVAKKRELTAEEVINKIIEKSEFTISDLIVNEETDRLLERFINQIKGLNLNVDQLLKAQNKTYDDLLADHKQIATNNIKSEFILNQIVKDNSLEAQDTEIEEFIQNLGDEKLIAQFSNPTEKWYIKGIIEKNKALDYLKNLGKEDKNE